MPLPGGAVLPIWPIVVTTVGLNPQLSPLLYTLNVVPYYIHLCQANMTHTRQSGPDSGLDIHARALEKAFKGWRLTALSDRTDEGGPRGPLALAYAAAGRSRPAYTAYCSDNRKLKHPRLSPLLYTPLSSEYDTRPDSGLDIRVRALTSF